MHLRTACLLSAGHWQSSLSLSRNFPGAVYEGAYEELKGIILLLTVLLLLYQVKGTNCCCCFSCERYSIAAALYSLRYADLYTQVRIRVRATAVDTAVISLALLYVELAHRRRVALLALFRTALLYTALSAPRRPYQAGVASWSSVTNLRQSTVYSGIKC